MHEKISNSYSANLTHFSASYVKASQVDAVVQTNLIITAMTALYILDKVLDKRFIL